MRDAEPIDTDIQVSKTILTPHKRFDGTKLGEIKAYLQYYKPYSKTGPDQAYELTKVLNYGYVTDISRNMLSDNHREYFMFGGYKLSIIYSWSIRYHSVKPFPIYWESDVPEETMTIYDFIEKAEILDETCDLDRYLRPTEYNNRGAMDSRYVDLALVNELNSHINACIVGYYDGEDYVAHKHRALRLLAYLKAFPAYYNSTRKDALNNIRQIITIFEKQLHEIHIDTSITDWNESGQCRLGNYRAY